MMIELMTAIFYPDIVAWSPNRRFRCEARSPHNLPEWHPGRVTRKLEAIWPNAFQRDFEFTLYEGDDARWSVEQARVSKDSPHAVHVSDRGSCVIRTHGADTAGLVTISPEGRIVQSLDLLEEVFVGAWASYVSRSTAGPFWTGGAHAFFVVLDGREHFCASTWWGQRILLDLEAGERADAARHADALGAAETRWALETLEELGPAATGWSGWPGEDALKPLGDLKAAAAIVSRSRPRGAEHQLRPFEPCRLLTWSTDCEEAGEMASISCFEVRALAALVLRRLGAIPEGYATFAFHLGETPVEVPERISDRSARAARVRPGMLGREVLALLGAPDCVSREWHYDLAERAQTLRIRWKNGVVETAELGEAAWLGEERDRELFRL